MSDQLGEARDAMRDLALNMAVPPELSTAMGGDIAAAALALSKAQGAMEPAATDGANPAFVRAGGKVHKYASLASCWDAARGPLSANGLAVVQLPSTQGPDVSVRTLLVHESGGWFSCTVSARARDASPQAIGSALSYLRRYSFAAAVGVAQEDDDGNAAQPDGQARPENGARSRQEPRGRQGASRGPKAVPNEAQAAAQDAGDGKPAMSDEEKELRATKVTPETLGKLEKRLAHAQLPADVAKTVRTYLDSKGVAFKEDGAGIEDPAELDEFNARRAVTTMEDAIRNTQKKAKA